MRSRFFFLAFSFFFIGYIKAQDARQFLPEISPEPEKNLLESTTDNDVTEFLPEKTPEMDVSRKDAVQPSIAISNVVTDLEMSQPATEREELRSTGETLQGAFEGRDNYLEYNRLHLVKDIASKGDKAFEFNIFYDTFQYTNKNGTGPFEHTYRTEGNSATSLMLRAAMWRYFIRAPFKFGWGVGLGGGYNSGYGYFANGAKSETKFNLWTVPLDVGLTFEVPAGQVAKFALSGGPSLIGVFQSRDDLDEKDKRKRFMQFSPGYFAAGKVGLSLGKIFPGSVYSMYSEFDVTNYFFTVDVRWHQYQNFKDKGVNIQGISMGAGFQFEYF